MLHPRVLCETKVKGTRLVNVFISVLYAEGFWVPARRGRRLASILQSFLLIYQECAGEALKRSMNRYPLVPKSHMLAHCAFQMMYEAQRGDWIMNPLSTANQQQEDFIGRPCRLSRRVHLRRIHLRVIQRSLLAGRQAEVDA